MQTTPPPKDIKSEDVKPSLRHLDSINSAALKPPEVSSPSHPLSPTADTPPGDFTTDPAGDVQEVMGEADEAKSLGGSSNGRGGSGGSSSFNWASIKVTLVHYGVAAEP